MSAIKSLIVGVAIASSLSAARADDARFVSWAYSEAPGRAFISSQIRDIPGVNVELIGFPFKNTLENLILRYRSGQPTEAAQIQERWLPTLAKMGALKDLNGVIGQDALNLVDPSLLATGQVDGKQYAVPWTAGSIAMVANKVVLDKAGIKQMPRTMQEFGDDLRAIKAAVPNSVPFGLSTSNPEFIQVESQIIFWQFGAHFFQDEKVAVDSEQSRKALQFIVDLVKDGLVAKGNDRFATRNLFAQELVGFYFDAPVARGFARKLTGQGPDYDKNVIVMPTPLTDSGQPPRSVIWAHLLGIMNGGDPNVAAGAKIISHFALDPNTQEAYWNALGLFPTTKAAISWFGKDAYVTNWIGLTKTALFDEPAAFANSAEISNIIGEEIQSAMLGLKTVDQAIADMAKRLTQATQ